MNIKMSIKQQQQREIGTTSYVNKFRDNYQYLDIKKHIFQNYSQDISIEHAYLKTKIQTTLGRSNIGAEVL